MIERVSTPRGDLQLQRRGTHYEVISNGSFLMATYNGGSERALIDLALEWLPQVQTVLIGGLGVGYTLRAALDLPGVRQVTVVEIEPKVVEWNAAHLADFNGHALADPHTGLVLADLNDYLTSCPSEAFDLIALDTDNGPDWTVYPENARLWGSEALGQLDRVRTRGGGLAFWSAAPSPPFERLLRKRFHEVRIAPITAALAEADDFVYLAR